MCGFSWTCNTASQENANANQDKGVNRREKNNVKGRISRIPFGADPLIGRV